MDGRTLDLLLGEERMPALLNARVPGCCLDLFVHLHPPCCVLGVQHRFRLILPPLLSADKQQKSNEIVPSEGAAYLQSINALTTYHLH